MKVFILIAALLFSGCSHKTIAKNCEPTESDYWVCDSLNALGK